MNRFRRAMKIFLCVLREIFDESSYARFLKLRNLPSSPSAYAAYWREREAVHARKPRCC
jgi:hypothetical protein